MQFNFNTSFQSSRKCNNQLSELSLLQQTSGVCVYFNWDIRINPIPHLVSQLVGPSLHLLQLIAHVSVFGHGNGEGWLGAWDGVSVMGLATQPGKMQILTCESLYVYVRK